jgi:hypothetical protein
MDLHSPRHSPDSLHFRKNAIASATMTVIHVAFRSLQLRKISAQSAIQFLIVHRIITKCSHEIHCECFFSISVRSYQCFHRLGNDAGSVSNEESNMIKKLLGAATMAAVVLAVAPASAAKMMGCGGDNMMKVENMVEAMPDGDAKWQSFKEITVAQAAMLEGHMGACSAHLSKAAHLGMMK